MSVTIPDVCYDLWCGLEPIWLLLCTIEQTAWPVVSTEGFSLPTSPLNSTSHSLIHSIIDNPGYIQKSHKNQYIQLAAIFVSIIQPIVLV